MAKQQDVVPRPLKNNEYEIHYATREAASGWMNLQATTRNAAVEAWDFLTKNPKQEGDRCYRLQGDLGIVLVDRASHERWQYKPTGGSRIWYVVIDSEKGSKTPGKVLLERVTTAHPNETVKTHR